MADDSEVIQLTDSLRLEEQIGKGGFATVWKASDSDLGGRAVAVKILDGPIGPEQREQFANELQILGPLSLHPNIVTVHSSGVTTGGIPYLVMELIVEGTLADRIAQEGALPWRESSEVVRQIAEGVAAVHSAGYGHYDIKPSNVLLPPLGPLLADFGIATTLSEERPADAASWLHAAPETVTGIRDSRSDVYSLGSTLFAAIAGRAPYELDAGNSPGELKRRLVNDPVPHLSGCPEWLATLLTKALSKDPADRPQTALAFATALEHGLAQKTGPQSVASVLDSDTTPEDQGASLSANIDQASAIGTDGSRVRLGLALSVGLLLAVAGSALAITVLFSSTNEPEVALDEDATATSDPPTSSVPSSRPTLSGSTNPTPLSTASTLLGPEGPTSIPTFANAEPPTTDAPTEPRAPSTARITTTQPTTSTTRRATTTTQRTTTTRQTTAATQATTTQSSTTATQRPTTQGPTAQPPTQPTTATTDVGLTVAQFESAIQSAQSACNGAVGRNGQQYIHNGTSYLVVELSEIEPNLVSGTGLPKYTGFAGANENNIIVGTDESEAVGGFGGDDIICGNGGNDALAGNSGNDILIGGAGADNFTGDDGDDLVSADQADLVTIPGGIAIRGGVGNDYCWQWHITHVRDCQQPFNQ